jgi:hypothetical protein
MLRSAQKQEAGRAEMIAKALYLKAAALWAGHIHKEVHMQNCQVAYLEACLEEEEEEDR